MDGSAILGLFLILGCGIPQSRTTDVTVKDKDGKICIYNSLMANFTIVYKTNTTNSTATLRLPETVDTDGSSCGTNSSVLMIGFGEGHSLSVNYSLSNNSYRAEVEVFTYNLGDTSSFPNATEKGLKRVEIRLQPYDIPVDTTYRCRSDESFEKDGITQTFWNVTLEVFVLNGTVSQNETVCPEDTPVTPTPTTAHTTAPNTTAHTTAPNTTAHTTAPNATTTAAPTTTTPAPPLPRPEKHAYNITDGNGTVCLLATMGLQVNYTLNGKDWLQVNINPNKTKAGGRCSTDGSESTLTLDDEEKTVAFSFNKSNSKKFVLQGVSVKLSLNGSSIFNSSNSSLGYWEASLGSSYMCNKQQTYSIARDLSITTLELRVQPFDVKAGKFSTAEECSSDKHDSFIVPIVVGVALGVLVLVVLVAYFVGRRKNPAGGYESF
ncbi:lysosome-associated membrane glycoprotein 2 isoform X1 [Lepisosteus oculatus]|uniref:lysosome-associated membrane glycoprotein 2 isoform X1 n=1 Tax=Lepisosteus oculatus TaxID=7918 RepID=UPI0037247203